MLAAKELLCPCAHELLDVVPVSGCAALDAAVCECTSFEEGCKRRHCIHGRDKRERTALPLDLVLQEGKDGGIECFEMAQHVFFFHDDFSSQMHDEMTGESDGYTCH